MDERTASLFNSLSETGRFLRSLLHPHVSRRRSGVAASDEVEEATDGLVSMVDGLGIQAMLDRRRVASEYQLRVIDTQLRALGIR